MVVNKGFEKYSNGIMSFGAITSEGLVPRDAPVFLPNGWCQNVEKLDNKLYFAPILEGDLSGSLAEYIWEDDCVSKHRTKQVIIIHHEIYETSIQLSIYYILYIYI